MIVKCMRHSASLSSWSQAGHRHRWPNVPGDCVAQIARPVVVHTGQFKMRGRHCRHDKVPCAIGVTFQVDPAPKAALQWRHSWASRGIVALQFGQMPLGLVSSSATGSRPISDPESSVFESLLAASPPPTVSGAGPYLFAPVVPGINPRTSIIRTLTNGIKTVSANIGD